MTHAIILFSHGSSDPEWAMPFRTLCARLQTGNPSVPVELAFLPPAAPTFEEIVAKLAHRAITEITVVPLFLARGGHVKVDLPQLISAAGATYPITFRQLPVIGDVPELQDAIAHWITGSLVCKPH